MLKNHGINLYTFTSSGMWMGRVKIVCKTRERFSKCLHKLSLTQKIVKNHCINPLMANVPIILAKYGDDPRNEILNFFRKRDFINFMLTLLLRSTDLFLILILELNTIHPAILAISVALEP